MNIEDYRYIVTIADVGSFTNAAKQLFIAQPSLSQRVKHIENIYGTEFFIRDSKGISLTAAGSCFVRHARKILECERELRQELADLYTANRNILRIGICNLIATQVFDDLFIQFQEQYPETECHFIQLPSLQLQRELSAGKIDVAICYLPIDNSELEYETLFYDKYVFLPAAGSSLCDEVQRAPRDVNGCIDRGFLAGIPFASGNHGSMLHRYLMSVIEDFREKPDIRYYTSNYPHLFSLAKAGIASTILYESFFDSKQEYMPYYYLDGPSNDLTVALAWRKYGYLCRPAKNIIQSVRGIIRGS